MISNETKSVIERAKQIYEQQREQLESEEKDRFIAIEPDSGDCFVEDSFDAAVTAARTAHPTRLSHTIHIGHPVAFHIGMMNGHFDN